MKRSALMATALLGALCLTTSAWAGGNACSSKDQGASAGSHCTYKGAATASSDHCAAGASMAGGKCTFGANTAVFSYAVNAHCGACVEKIQSAALAQKGVLCAKVDLDSKTAYIAGDKKMDQRAVTKAIKDAGFTCSLKQSGPKARAELTKLMAADMNAPASPKKS
jgi:copper chaperone CopZ